MTIDVRLAEVITALESVGIVALVMGGHAVRFYGIQRTTNAVDLHLSPDQWDELPGLLARSPLAATTPLAEGPSWRPATFRRFQIGVLPSGGEEWLEFWRGNHLLPTFGELYSRRVEGDYGGRRVAFLSVQDLIRSKETERLKDWEDITLLEEVSDAALRAQFLRREREAVSYIAGIRSRRGLERLTIEQDTLPPGAITAALEATRNPITQALLLPLAPSSTLSPADPTPLEPLAVEKLRQAPVGSGVHIAFIVAVRKRYRDARMDLDRADKQATLAARITPP